MPWKECQPVDERLRFVARLIDWDRVCIDASHVQAKKGAPRRARARSTAASRARSTI